MISTKNCKHTTRENIIFVPCENNASAKLNYILRKNNEQYKCTRIRRNDKSNINDRQRWIDIFSKIDNFNYRIELMSQYTTHLSDDDIISLMTSAKSDEDINIYIKSFSPHAPKTPIEWPID
ncbi:hypothetical protein J6A31_04610 [bacterium]|nr:hypothetical protein [bacterium]